MAKNIDVNLINHIVNTYSDTILRIAYQYTKNINDSEDIVQDTLFSVIKRGAENLSSLSEEKLKAFYDAHKGEKATVLWESKKVDNCMYGFTENYIKVSCSYDKAKINTFEEIVI